MVDVFPPKVGVFPKGDKGLAVFLDPADDSPPKIPPPPPAAGALVFELGAPPNDPKMLL